MASTHQPYNTPNTGTGTHSLPAYHHWMDDAAQMGLMLYRMRNDSKRERILRGHPPLQNPPDPVRVVPQRSVPTPHPQNATPRTAAALQVPTVATASTTGPVNLHHHQHQHHHTPPLHLPLD